MNNLTNNEVNVIIYGPYEISGDLYIPGTVKFEEGSCLLLNGCSSFACNKLITCSSFSIMSIEKDIANAKVQNSELSQRAATEQQELVQSSPVAEKNDIESKKASPVVSAKSDDKQMQVINEEIAANATDESTKELLSVVAEKAQEELGETELNEEEEEEENEISASKKEESIKDQSSAAIEKQSEYDIFDFDMCQSGIQSQLKNSEKFLQSQVIKDNISGNKDQPEEKTEDVLAQDNALTSEKEMSSDVKEDKASKE